VECWDSLVFGIEMLLKKVFYHRIPGLVFSYDVGKSAYISPASMCHESERNRLMVKCECLKKEAQIKTVKKRIFL
jgi:hypothetical protein